MAVRCGSRRGRGAAARGTDGWITRGALAVLSALGAACGPGAAPGNDGGGGGSDSGGGGGGPVRDLAAPQMGIATFYDATGAGNCSFDPSPGDLRVAAMNDPQWDGSAVCGSCVRVTGPRGAVTVRIVDRCPECASGHLDLSREAFAMVADPAAGRVPITWQRVSCDVAGPIAYHFKDGSSQWWVAIQVRNHRLPIARLEAQRADGSWTTLPRESYNYFVASGGLGPGPLTLRVTAEGGQQLTDTGITLRAETTVPGARQFD